MGYNKSPQVPGLSFPFSYRDSTFLSIFAVPNNAVFWITSNLTFTLIIIIITIIIIVIIIIIIIIIIIVIIIIIMLLLLLYFEVHVKQSLRCKSKTNISPLSLILFPSLFDIQEQNSAGIVPITKPWQGGLRIWKGWGCSSEIWIKSLKVTNLGVAQAFFHP